MARALQHGHTYHLSAPENVCSYKSLQCLTTHEIFSIFSGTQTLMDLHYVTVSVKSIIVITTCYDSLA